MHIRNRIVIWSQRLYVRLFAMIAAVILIFQLVLTLFLTRYYTEQYEAQVRELGSATLSNAAYAIGSAIQKADETAYVLSYNDNVQRFLNLTDNQSDFYTLNARREVTTLIKTFRLQCAPGVEYTLYAIGPKAGVFTTINSSTSNAGYAFKKEPWYLRYVADDDLRRDFLPDQSVAALNSAFTQPVHLFTYRIHSIRTLAPNGFLVMQIDRSTFDDLIGNLPSAIQNVSIVDAEGNMLYDDIGFLPRERLQQLSQNQPGQIQSDAEGNHYMPLAHAIDSLGWHVLCTVDASNVVQNLHTIRMIAMLAMMGSLLILLPIIYNISRRITGPVARLSAGMEHIRLGHYDVMLPVERPDEIGLLTESFNGMAEKLLAANARLKRYEALQQSISFYALQQQVNPHFLYNTLDMIIGMATQHSTDSIISVTSGLAALFRYNLARELTVPLEAEIAHLRHYFTILKFRSPDRIRLDLNVDMVTEGAYVPKLILQPFLENCIQHGFSGRQSDCEVRIIIRESPKGIVDIQMSDNGAGFPPQLLHELNSAFERNASEVPVGHIGMLNVYARLRLIYQEGFIMEAQNSEDGGACIHLRFPIDAPISLV